MFVSLSTCRRHKGCACDGAYRKKTSPGKGAVEKGQAHDKSPAAEGGQAKNTAAAERGGGKEGEQEEWIEDTETERARAIA